MMGRQSFLFGSSVNGFFTQIRENGRLSVDRRTAETRQQGRCNVALN